MGTSRVADAAYELLVRDLRAGLYPPGARLPGERELSARLGISRVTLRSALSMVEAEGLVQRSAQRGWFVPRRVIGEPPSTLQSFTEMARARGLKATAKVMRQEIRSATFEEAEKLRIAPSAPVVQIDRLRGMAGTPVCYDSVVVVFERAPAIADADLTDRSLYDELLTRCDVAIHRSAYSVEASVADDKLARLLKMTVGAPVLVGSEVAYTIEGVPVLVGENHYRGDAYRFEADLYRT